MNRPGELSLRERREGIVREHMAAENRKDIEATIATFSRPRYEVNGVTSDGEDAVRELLHALMTGFPNFRADVERMRHVDDAVLVEGRLSGTHAGSFAGLAASGRTIDVASVAIFEFDDDRLVCEKVFYDVATLLTQVGALPEPGVA